MLRPGGALIAVTNSIGHLDELRELIALPDRLGGRRSAARTARRSCAAFRAVERFDMESVVTVREREKLVAYRDSLVVATAPVPDDVELPFVVHGRTTDLRRDDVIRPAELIQRKRDGEELADDELAELILGYARGEVPDYQMAAFCMAVFFRGLSERETFVLTDAMIRERRDDRARRGARAQGRRQALDRRRRRQDVARGRADRRGVRRARSGR